MTANICMNFRGDLVVILLSKCMGLLFTKFCSSNLTNRTHENELGVEKGFKVQLSVK
jgi:hypothetical protein